MTYLKQILINKPIYTIKNNVCNKLLEHSDLMFRLLKINANYNDYQLMSSSDDETIKSWNTKTGDLSTEELKGLN